MTMSMYVKMVLESPKAGRWTEARIPLWVPIDACVLGPHHCRITRLPRLGIVTYLLI